MTQFRKHQSYMRSTNPEIKCPIASFKDIWSLEGMEKSGFKISWKK